jgi:hypothetical protein
MAYEFTLNTSRKILNSDIEIIFEKLSKQYSDCHLDYDNLSIRIWLDSNKSDMANVDIHFDDVLFVPLSGNKEERATFLSLLKRVLNNLYVGCNLEEL